VVESGLRPGDRVIVEGVGKVRGGMPVKPLLVAASAAPGGAGAEPAGADK
jgi:membrane fusion protein (multidrug efflux system)